MKYTYFSCTACWRVYSDDQLLAEDRGGCDCGSFRFKGVKKPNKVILQRLFTDLKYTIKALFKERLNHE